MLIESESNVLSQRGLQQTSNFQIATTAHAFRILSSGLYSDKISAVLREIGCNASDAHIAAGKPDVPFEVHLPSRLSARFYIRDFGIGLTPDEVLSLYTTYFSSSKQQSNDFTGAFGLGSKSPFSYTDSFTITSVKDGVKTTYSAYVGQVGSPQVSKIAESPADQDWQSGVMVSMAVKPNDYYEFQQKAQKIFSQFRVIPKMVNSDPVVAPTYLIETPEYALPADINARGVWVVMGNVRYPVPTNEYQANGAHSFAQHVHPILRMPIGTVDVAASRENLEYTPKTRAAITQWMDKVGVHVAKKIVAEASKLDLTTWTGLKEANVWLNANANKWGAQTLREFLEKGGMDKDTVEKCGDLMYRHATPTCPITYTGTAIEYHLNTRGHLKRQEEKYDYNGQTGARYRLPVNLQSNPAIVLLGKTKFVKDRLREALTGQFTNVIIVSDDDAEATRVAKLWYDFPTIKAEDLPLPAAWIAPKNRVKKPKAVAGANASAKMAVLQSDGTVQWESNRLLANIPADEKFYVCPTVAWGNYKWWFGGQSVHNPTDNVEAILQLSQHVKDLPKGIALIKAGDVKRWQLNKNGWRDIKDILPHLLSDDVRNLVSKTEQKELAGIYNGRCQESGSPLLFFASHAKADTDFWKYLKFQLPTSQIIVQAAHCAAGSGLVTSSKPIPNREYNDVLSIFGEWHRRIVSAVVAGEDPSAKYYPSFYAVLTHQFPNDLVELNERLAAQVVAQLIDADEKKLSTYVNLAA